MVEQVEREATDWTVPPAWVVGARTMLVDRAVPRLEFLWMPATVQAGGPLKLVRTRDGEAPECKKGWKVLAHRLRYKDTGVEAPSGPILDVRGNIPENWAHALIYHLPLAQWAAEWLGEKPTVLVTQATPAYIRRLYAHFGFPVIATSRPVRGDIVMPQLLSYDALRPVRHEMVAGLTAELDQRRAAGELPAGLPKKIFVVRAKTRRISNEPEIEAYLAERGFVKVLPERMTVPEQIELFNTATDIVAIHGAALAPLVFRSPDAPPFDLVEILTAGHMATGYRLMASQVNGRYVGVRGRIKPEMVEKASKLGMYTEHSLDDFEVDLESVKAAFAILAEGAPPEMVA